MAVYDTIYRHLLFPAWHLLQRDGANKALREARAVELCRRPEMEALQRRKLEALLEHAAKTVPYWKAAAARLGLDAHRLMMPEEFVRLPVLTKAVIRQAGTELVSTDLSGNRLDPNTTSGSTGEAMRFFTDLRSKMFRKAAEIRAREWVGVRQGERVAHLWGSQIDQARAENVRGRLHGKVARELYLSAYKLSDRDMEKHAAEMRSFAPRLLIGYPSVLVEFGRHCRTRGHSFPSLTSIICSAEALYEPQREEIRGSFGVPVYNRYGCREVGCIAQERPGIEGLVVNSDRVMLEIVDADGIPVSPGEVGEILVTDLDNYGMPLIRYQIGDRAAWREWHDDALAFPMLSMVEGRSLDVVCTPTGERVGGTFWTILFRSRPGMGQTQVVQPAMDRILVRFVRDQSGAPVDEEYFRSRIVEHCGQGLVVQFEEVSRIDPEPSGKYRVVKSEVAN